MYSECQDMDLIDLINDHHILLHKISEKSWNDSSDIYISDSEWFIMAKIYKKHPTISYVAKHVDITRQATHKFIKSLEAKGLIEVTDSKINNKDKCVRLTTLGEKCYENNASLKLALEQKIAEKIGVEQVKVLKDILKLDWGL